LKDVSNQLAAPPLYIAIRSEKLPVWEIPSSGDSSPCPELTGKWRRSFNCVGLALSMGATGMFCSLGAVASPDPVNANAPDVPLPRLLANSQTVPLQAPVLLSAAEVERSGEPNLQPSVSAPKLEGQDAQEGVMEQAQEEIPSLEPLAAAVPAPVSVAVADVSQPIQVIPPPEVEVPIYSSLPALEANQPEGPLPTPTQVAAVGLDSPVSLSVVKAPEASPRLAESEFPPQESQPAPQLPALLPLQRRTETAELATPAPQTASISLPPAPAVTALNPQSPVSIPVLPPLEAESPQAIAPPVLLPANTAPRSQYQVRVGDTLNSIAKQHGLSTAQLIRANGISNPNHLKVSQTLVIPQTQETDLLAQVPSENFGDTAPARSLSRLQRQYQPREQIIGAAPATPDAYNDSLQLPLGQEVGPKLPPLSTPDFPEAPTQFTGYIWPAQGVLTSGFGRRWGRMHRGIDIAGPIGTPIVAAAAGYVVSSGWNSGGFGNLVKIRHEDGSVTYYAHNHRLLVRTGDYVQQGQQIAEMGSTGRSTGPHLHFEIRPDGKRAVNPMALMARR
jgi:murein DD-endopeptidase MepM/ murein hydrolase activator NlpD